MPSEIGIHRLFAVVLVLCSAMPASSWNLPSGTRTFSRGSTRGEQTSTCHPTTHPAYPVLGGSTAMRAAAPPSPSDDSSPSSDAARPASLTRVDWLRIGASLAVIAPVIGIADGSSDAASAATQGASVTVLGAGGKTGRECVEYLASRGTGVRAVARSLTNKEGEPLAFTTTKGVAMETADVTVPSSLRGVIEGSSAVIFASSASKQGGSAKAVDYEGVINVAKACLEAKVPRLVLVSSGGVASPESSIYKFLNLFGEIMSWKIRGEDELRSMYAAQGAGAACHYTIVRPGGLTLDPPRGVAAIELNQGDTKSGRIARSDVARVCVESIYSSKSEDCTLECYYQDTGKTLEAVGLSNILKKTDGGAKHLGTESTGDTWDAIFSGLKRDA